MTLWSPVPCVRHTRPPRPPPSRWACANFWPRPHASGWPRSTVQFPSLLAANRVVCHPAVRGEIALGSIARRDEVLRLLAQLPRAPVVGDDEVFALIETRKLSASGIGWIDAHLLAAAMAGRHVIWTGD